jgi:hypothetical protein
VREFLPSYGDRPNDASTLVTCKSCFSLLAAVVTLMIITIDLKEKFRDVLKQNYYEDRNSYFYATCVVVSRLDVSAVAFSHGTHGYCRTQRPLQRRLRQVTSPSLLYLLH